MKNLLFVGVLGFLVTGSSFALNNYYTTCFYNNSGLNLKVLGPNGGLHKIPSGTKTCLNIRIISGFGYWSLYFYHGKTSYENNEGLFSGPKLTLWVNNKLGPAYKNFPLWKPSSLPTVELTNKEMTIKVTPKKCTQKHMEKHYGCVAIIE